MVVRDVGAGKAEVVIVGGGVVGFDGKGVVEGREGCHGMGVLLKAEIPQDGILLKAEISQDRIVIMKKD